MSGTPQSDFLKLTMRLLVVSVIFLVMVATTNRPIRAEVDHALVPELTELLLRRSSPVATSYQVDLRQLQGPSLELVRHAELEVLLNGNRLRMKHHLLVDNAEPLGRPTHSGWLVNDHGSFRVVKNGDDAYFRLTSATNDQVVEQPDCAGAIQLHQEAMHTIGNWMASAVILPGLKNANGHQLQRLEKINGQFEITVLCTHQESSLLKDLGLQEDLTFSFVVDEAGLLNTWSYPYSKDHPDALVSTSIEWNSAEQFLSSQSQLRNGNELKMTWLAKASGHSGAPLEANEFSLSHFGLNDPRTSIAPIYLAGFLVASFIGGMIWIRRSR